MLLMCDYLAEPVWTADGRTSLDLSTLPLTPRTKQELRAWAARYDTLLTRDFDWTEDEQRRFDAEGRRLWRVVSDELGSRFEVGYFSDMSDRQVWDRAELDEAD